MRYVTYLIWEEGMTDVDGTVPKEELTEMEEGGAQLIAFLKKMYVW
ncbi:hypothetical protein [Sphingobacterium sp. 1.A.4]|nr:hypothetical protein [Sphingobacterium sp. 1.A.4]